MTLTRRKIRTSIAIVIAAVSLAGSVIAGPNVKPAAADQTLGMALMSAVVNADGSLARGSGAVSSVRTTTGQYRVIFDRPIRDCTFTASGGGATPGLSYLTTANVWSLPNDESGVGVITSANTTAADINSGFHLLVFCAR